MEEKKNDAIEAALRGDVEGVLSATPGESPYVALAHIALYNGDLKALREYAENLDVEEVSTTLIGMRNYNLLTREEGVIHKMSLAGHAINANYSQEIVAGSAACASYILGRVTSIEKCCCVMQSIGKGDVEKTLADFTVIAAESYTTSCEQTPFLLERAQNIPEAELNRLLEAHIIACTPPQCIEAILAAGADERGKPSTAHATFWDLARSCGGKYMHELMPLLKEKGISRDKAEVEAMISAIMPCNAHGTSFMTHFNDEEVEANLEICALPFTPEKKDSREAIISLGYLSSEHVEDVGAFKRALSTLFELYAELWDVPNIVIKKPPWPYFMGGICCGEGGETYDIDEMYACMAWYCTFYNDEQLLHRIAENVDSLKDKSPEDYTFHESLEDLGKFASENCDMDNIPYYIKQAIDYEKVGQRYLEYYEDGHLFEDGHGNIYEFYNWD